LTFDKNMIGRSGVAKVDPLNDYQDEVADILREECCELGQAASKLQRCGQGFTPTNGERSARKQFAIEVADVLLLLDEAAHSGLIDFDYLREAIAAKPERLRTWTHSLADAPKRFANADLLRFKVLPLLDTEHEG